MPGTWFILSLLMLVWLHIAARRADRFWRWERETHTWLTQFETENRLLQPRWTAPKEISWPTR